MRRAHDQPTFANDRSWPRSCENVAARLSMSTSTSQIALYSTIDLQVRVKGPSNSFRSRVSTRPRPAAGDRGRQLRARLLACSTARLQQLRPGRRPVASTNTTGPKIVRDMIGRIPFDPVCELRWRCIEAVSVAPAVPDADLVVRTKVVRVPTHCVARIEPSGWGTGARASN